MSLPAERYCVDDVTMHSYDLSFNPVQFAVTARSGGGAGLLKLPRIKTKCRVRV
jgi:hypothetical protein